MTATRWPDLRAIDERWLPEAARRLRVIVHRLQVAGGAVSGGAGRGFTALRTRPKISGALLAVALVAGGVAVAAGNHHTPAPQQTSPLSPTGGYSYTTLGPQPGQSVASYLQQARRRLDQLVAGRPDASTVAIVDFRTYRNPREVAAAFAGLQLTQVHYRVQVRGLPTRPHVAAVSGTDQIATVIERSGQVEAATAASLFRYSSSLPATTPALKAQRDAFVQQARVSQAESKLLTSTCRCVFAVVVQAPAKRLQRIAALSGVRVVDPAPAGSESGSVGFMPLLPEVTTTVPKTGALQ